MLKFDTQLDGGTINRSYQSNDEFIITFTDGTYYRLVLSDDEYPRLWSEALNIKDAKDIHIELGISSQAAKEIKKAADRLVNEQAASLKMVQDLMTAIRLCNDNGMLATAMVDKVRSMIAENIGHWSIGFRISLTGQLQDMGY